MNISVRSILFLVSLCIYSWAETVTFGIYPLLSPALLIHRTQPLADYIESTGIDSVSIKVAGSYEEFIRTCQNGGYDFVQAPAHIAAYLIDENGFKPVIQFDFSLSAIMVTIADSPVKSMSDLRTRKIAVPDQFAFVTIATILHLHDSGLRANRDYTLIKKSTHDRALMAVMRNEVDACVMSSAMLGMVDTTVQNRLKVLASIDNLSGDLILLHKGSVLFDKGREYFETFKSGEYGKAFSDKWAIDASIETVPDYNTGKMQPYIKVIDELLKNGNTRQAE